MRNITSNNSRANERVWIDICVAEKLSTVRLHLHQCTSCQRCERRTGGIDFVTEHPHMPSGNPPVLAALKTQHGQGRMFGKDLRGGRNHLKLAAMAAKTDYTRPGMANHLISQTSPYLLQHAHNPVDWYPWGEEAFERARREKKPIHLSVGYAACHWCHVMAHESFEDDAVAQVLNERLYQHQGRPRGAARCRSHLPDRAANADTALWWLAAHDVPDT